MYVTYESQNHKVKKNYSELQVVKKYCSTLISLFIPVRPGIFKTAVLKKQHFNILKK